MSKKYYLNEIENVAKIEVFEEIQFVFQQDESDEFFTEDKAIFDWWTLLANSIDYLENNGIEIEEVNELQDYIDAADAYQNLF